MMKLSPFLTLSSSELVIQQIQFTSAIREPRRIHSMPGMGKTTTLKEYAKHQPAKYCEVGYCDKDVAGLYRLILKSFGHFCNSTERKRELLEMVEHSLKAAFENCEFFQNRIQVLLFDEYQTFEAVTLRELLRLQEKYRFPLILSGNSQRLSKHSSCVNANKQNSSRAGPIVEVLPPTLSDCELIADHFKLMDQNVRRLFLCFAGERDLRTTYKVINEALFLRQGLDEIQIEHLQLAMRNVFQNNKKAFEKFLLKSQQTWSVA